MLSRNENLRKQKQIVFFFRLVWDRFLWSLGTGLALLKQEGQRLVLQDEAPRKHCCGRMIKLFRSDAPRLIVLTNNMHDLQHYWNLATYMRIKRMVPPSSEQPPQAQQAPANIELAK